ncbi:MAG TPA: DUF1697 domain-containing protein [Rhizomicrobium sp.]|jgi:uncharacterized protein (DUF1697 family)|nr:DUF1697 domain-containing protein [Rhizomicrobium sp.]
MSLQVALLRAVNVGGTGLVLMADLRATAQKAGLKQVRSLLQSGNLVFDAGAKAPAAVERLLETACSKTFGLKTEVYVRSSADFGTLVAGNPFVREAANQPSRLHVIFLRAAPPPEAFQALQASVKGPEIVRPGGRHAYVYYPDGMGTSKLTLAVIARHLGMPGTARNWNTVLKLAALASA